jgi:ABC-type antimicrobial peptide transport system ATPase subunit
MASAFEAVLNKPSRSRRKIISKKMLMKTTNDQLAIEPPKNVQSILVQSPLPLKIMGTAR